MGSASQNKKGHPVRGSLERLCHGRDFRRKVTHGPHELGKLDKHSPDGLRDIKQARAKWDDVYREVFKARYPSSLLTRSAANPATKLTAQSKVPGLIVEWERRRKDEWEDNARINWEYYRDNYLTTFFGTYSIAEINHDELVMHFMREIAKRRLSIWVAKKAFSYVSSLLDLAMNLGVIQGNAAKTIPKSKRYPKGIRRPKGQPFISLEQFVALLDFIKIPRDRIILKILFYCALRRSELFVLKWKDFQVQTGGIFYFEIQRSFCSRTHKIKEWDEEDGEEEENAEELGNERKRETETKSAHFLKAHGRVVLPPTLVADIRGWAQYGHTDATDPESFIFPTRNGTCIIPPNWAEDVLKPAGEKIDILRSRITGSDADTPPCNTTKK
jgi:integrase